MLRLGNDTLIKSPIIYWQVKFERDVFIIKNILKKKHCMLYSRNICCNETLLYLVPMFLNFI